MSKSKTLEQTTDVRAGDSIDSVPRSSAERGPSTQLPMQVVRLADLEATVQALVTRALAILLRVFKRLGLPVAVHKLEGPGWCLSFLGFEVDSNALEVRLPRSNLLELKELLATWQSRRTCRKKELESLVGKLAHACKVVRPGKTFLRRMFEVVSGVHQPHHHVRLNAEFRSDLTWWATFLESWNGVSLLQEFGPRQISHQFVSDASGSFGCGALWEFRWLQLQWPQSCREDFVQLTEASITLKELLPVVIACAVWGREWQNSTVLVHCDNVGAVSTHQFGLQ